MQESLAVAARRQTGEVRRGEAPSLGTTAMFTSSHDFQIVNSTLSVAGGDIHHHNHYHSEPARGIWAVLNSIPNFRSIYHDMLEKATPGTGMWLIKGEKFRVWLEFNGDIKIFWGSGIPGAGKTVLASIVIQYLEALRTESSSAICVCYVYFRYSQGGEVTVRDVLETLVKQTLERHPDCQALIERVYAQHLNEGSQPTVPQLQGLLRELADRMACTFYILDALDEAPAKIQLTVVKSLSLLNIKLFITSRPLETVQAKFPQAAAITICAHDTDLDLHIAKGIDDSVDLQGLLDQEDPLLKEEIVSTIKRNCGGMFLHASLQLEALCDCISAHEVRRTLQTFPPKLEDVYLYTWDRILKQKTEHVSLAKAVLVWVLSASRSMTVDELRRAAATSPDTHQFQADRVVPSTTLISLCRGLVTFEEESRLVRLVHYTARDTLEGLLEQEYPHPHSLLAAVCMTHLTKCGFQNTAIKSWKEFEAVLKKDPLLAYASETWAFHARSGLYVEEAKHQAAQFIKECKAFPALIEAGHIRTFDVLTPLHILALYKLPVALIKGPIGNPNLTTTLEGKTPLMMASESAHKELVTVLIALPETEVNQVGFGSSPLALAARQGHESVVKLLLADPRVQVNLVDGRRWSALLNAAKKGYEAIVRLLLAQPGIQVNLIGGRRWSALMHAARIGHEGIVRLLLAHPGIQINLADPHRSTALLLASQYGHNAVVELLLPTDAFDINASDNDGDTAIKMAAKYGHEAVVRLLLDAPNIDITVRSTRDGHTAVSAAQVNGHSVISALLRDFLSRNPADLGPREIDQLFLRERRRHGVYVELGLHEQ